MQTQMPFNPVIELNPTLIMSQPQYHPYWHALFMQEECIEAGKIYNVRLLNSNEADTKQVVQCVKVTKDIIRYMNKRQEPRFLILGSEIGTGSYAVVYNGLAKIKLSDFEGEITYKDYTNNSKYAVKAQQHDDSHPIQKAIDEATIAKKLFELRAKSPVFNRDQTRSFTIERHANGKELISFMNEEARQSTFTTDHRLKLTWFLLRAFKEQIINPDIVNADVKPDNIKIDENKNSKLVIVDAGFAMHAKVAKKSKKFCGTPLFTAPEVWANGEVSQLADLFSMGVVIHQLWKQSKLSVERVEDEFDAAIEAMNTYIEDVNSNSSRVKESFTDVRDTVTSTCVKPAMLQSLLKQITEVSNMRDVGKRQIACQKMLKNLKQAKDEAMQDRASRYHEETIDLPKDLSKKHQAQFRLVLKLLTSHNPEDRNIDIGLDQLEQVIFQRKLLTVDTALHSALTLAHNKAIELRKSIEENNQIRILKLDHDDVVEIKDETNQILSEIEDSPEAISQFVETLGIEAVREAKPSTREQVQLRINMLIDDFFNCIANAEKILDDVENDLKSSNPSPLAEKIKCRLAGVNKSYKVFNFTFDRMVFVTEKFEKELAAIAPIYEQFKHAKSASQSGYIANNVFSSSSEDKSVVASRENSENLTAISCVVHRRSNS